MGHSRPGGRSPCRKVVLAGNAGERGSRGLSGDCFPDRVTGRAASFWEGRGRGGGKGERCVCVWQSSGSGDRGQEGKVPKVLRGHPGKDELAPSQQILGRRGQG